MFKRIDIYIGKQLFIATLFGVSILTALLIMGNLFKELRPLLVEENASLGLLLRFIGSLLPFSLIYTLPWGFLVAVLLVFGRLSADNELTAMRMAGWSLPRIALSTYILAIFFCGISLWLNMDIAPRAKDTVKYVLYEVVRDNPATLLNPGIVQTRFKDQKVFVEKRTDNTLHGLHLFQIDEENPRGFPKASLYAREAQLRVIHASKQLRLRLTDAFLQTNNEKGNTEMAFIAKQEPLLFDFAEEHQKKRKPNAMTQREIHTLLHHLPEDFTAKQRAMLHNEVHRRYAFSLACLSLSMIAVPLGITTRRKETSSGLLLGFFIGLSYFLFFMVAKEFEKDAGYTALSLYWLANLICWASGFFLLRRAARR